MNITVVIPCLNDAPLLERCLKSLARQHRLADAVVVADNGSFDNSVDVATSHNAVVVAEPRRGITWAAAAGYDEACRLGADAIVRTDADAWLPPHFLADVERAWQRAPEHVVGLTGPAHFDGLPHVISRLYLGLYMVLVGSALGHPPLFGTNCTFRALWWQSVRRSLDLADTQVHDDMQLSFAVGPVQTVRIVPHLVVGMDRRALEGRCQRRRRLRRGWHSMMRGFAVSPPWRRLPQRARIRMSA